MNWQHRTIITPMALAEPARAACMALTGSASEGLFTTTLYSTEADATHAISSGYIAGELADLLPCGDHGRRGLDDLSDKMHRRATDRRDGEMRGA